MQKNYGSTRDVQLAVKDALNFHRGRLRAIKRWDLVRLIFGDEAVTPDSENDDNPFDRKVRDAIETLRIEERLHICNMGDGKGYFLAATREEWEAFKEYYLGPQKKKYLTVKVLDERADEYWGKQAKPAPEGQAVMLF